jgi:quinoprotein glucose dehydrogenase
MLTPGSRVSASSAPTIYKNLVITGGQIFERSSREPPGVVRAYDAITGALVWTWNPGYPENTVSDQGYHAPVRPSPNAWAPPSIDESLGLIYLPTSVQKPNAWGGNRDPKGEAFSSSIVALEADIGRVRWVYQTVHHDVWDWDVGAQPTLVDLRTGNGIRPALLAATKRGDIFVLDRRTGEPIVPAPEKPVPQGAPPRATGYRQRNRSHSCRFNRRR